ncbi:MAG: DUF4153 domain-containing protein [Prevotellaceae bacterium]|jgi:hypothetical protein|nr:DUF4153 domain-containing protein [Prevotellaceae bacterium]
MMGSILILVLIILAAGASATMVKNKKEPNVANRFFSITSITEKLSLLLKRFPISILLVAGLAVLFFVAINSDFDDVSYRLWFFFSVGAFISIAAVLFSEDFLNYLKTCVITLFSVLLWGLYCLFLPEKADDVQTGKIIEISVISAVAFCSMFFISFLKKNQDRAFWNFTTQTLFQMTLACCFGSILFGGLSLALLAIDSLFGVSVAGEVYAHLAVVCFALFAPLYFLANIPAKAEKHNQDIFYTKIQKILSLYILMPILAVYAVILYAYLFKIVIAWELPNGWVSWLVSALALGGLLVITFLFPVREQESNKAVNFISRWFGLLILPLLLLMTVGIFRRIGDYGITINRGYVLLLNIWFYGIYIYLFLTNSKHIKWILISMVAVALLVSVNFWGVANVTRNSLSKEVSAILNKQTSAEEARAVFAGMTQDEKDGIKSKLEYLHRNFGKESVQPFFSDTVSDSYWNFLSKLELNEALDEKSERIYYYANNEKVWKIEGYNAFTEIEYYDYKTRNTENLSKDVIEISAGDRTFSIPVKKIVAQYLAADEKLRAEQEWSIQNDNYTILISRFSGDYYPEKDSVFISNLDGYLFFKK